MRTMTVSSSMPTTISRSEADDLPGLIAAFNRRDELWGEWQARDKDAPWREKWWFADAAAIEREDWNLSGSRYRPESGKQPSIVIRESCWPSYVTRLQPFWETSRRRHRTRGERGVNAFPFVTLGDAVQVNPGLPRNVRPGENTPISFVPMAAVCEKAGSIASPEVRPFREVSQGFTLFADNDVLFAKITPCMEHGKAAIARNLVNGQGAGSTEFFVLRPSPFVLPEFVYYFVRRGSFRASCKAHFSGSAGQRRVPRSYLEKVLFPLPPLEEQRRVVGLLDRAAEIRRRAEAARAKARTIIPALFLDTFGDPATNPKGWPTARLGALAKLTGGGTPSKANAAFWGGTIPWVSPKDMKPPTIFGSEDKITEAAMAASPVSLIPAGNVLIVVRG